MNNIIICSRDNNKDLNEIIACLNENKINYKILYFEQNQISLEEINNLLRASTHFTVIPDNGAFETGNNKYILGYIAGSNKNILIYDKNNNADLSYLNRNTQNCRTVSEISEYYKKEKKIFLVKKRMRYARIELKKNDLCLSVSSMFHVVEKGLNNLLKLFIMAGYSPDLKKNTGLSLLSFACRKGHLETAKMLLQAGADVNLVSDDRGNTPVMDAASEGHDNIVDLLLENGAELDIKSKNGQTALILAIGASKTSTAVKLIKAGADVTIKDVLGMDARKYAELFKNNEILDLLL